MVKREKKGGTRKKIAKALKRCNKCHEIKELIEFYSDRSRSDGLGSKCKQCEYECRALRYQKLKNRPSNKIPHIENKRCSKCNEVKPVAEFYPALRNKDGYCDLCKSCSKKQTQSYHRRLAARIPQEMPRIKNKRCSKCGELKSISAFSKAVGKLDGYRAVCKECDSKSSVEYRRKVSNREFEEIQTIGEKRCWMCKRLLPVEEFNYARSNYDGFANHCRECGIKYKRQHYEENYGNEYNRVKEYRRRYPERNRAFA
ncbi:MAG: hypothetical protein JSV32_01405, partial [Dehalococcoidia bacterium]